MPHVQVSRVALDQGMFLVKMLKHSNQAGALPPGQGIHSGQGISIRPGPCHAPWRLSVKPQAHVCLVVSCVLQNTTEASPRLPCKSVCQLCTTYHLMVSAHHATQVIPDDHNPQVNGSYGNTSEPHTLTTKAFYGAC